MTSFLDRIKEGSPRAGISTNSGYKLQRFERLVFSASLLALLVGCQSVRPKTSPNFIEPLSNLGVASDSKIPTPKTEAELCIRTAEAVAMRGHFVEAIKLYEQAEILDSKSDPLDRQLAPLYAQANQIDQALVRYQRAIDRSPDDAELRNNYAWALLDSKRSQLALTTIDEALSEFPNNRRLQSTRAVAFYHRGDRTAALEQFVALYGNSAAHHNLAILDIEAGKEGSAHDAVIQAVATNPTEETLQLATALSIPVR